MAMEGSSSCGCRRWIACEPPDPYIRRECYAKHTSMSDLHTALGWGREACVCFMSSEIDITTLKLAIARDLSGQFSGGRKHKTLGRWVVARAC